MKRIDFNTRQEERNFLEKYSDVENFKIYGFQGALNMYAHLNERFPGTIEYNPKYIKIINVDIETRSDEGFPDVVSANMDITAITVGYRGRYVVFGLKKFENDNPKKVKYHHCDDEEDMLRRFLNLLENIDADVVTGWNIEGFDVPYLYHRITNVCGKKHADRLSPHGVVLPKTIKVNETYEINTYDILGLVVLDYMALYKKFSFKDQESFSLDNISSVELNETKLDYSEYGTLHGLYVNNYQKYITYNIRDVELVDRLEAKLGFIEQVFAIAYSSKVMYSDTLASVKIWDVILHNHLMEKNIVVDPITRHQKIRPNAGGFVKQPEKGMYHWLVSFDLNSLYPSLIQQFNISPETYINSIDEFQEYCDGEYNPSTRTFSVAPAPEKCVDAMLDGYIDKSKYDVLKSENVIMSGSGALFDKSRRGFIPEVMSIIYEDRTKYKKKMIIAKQELELIKAEMDKRGIKHD